MKKAITIICTIAMLFGCKDNPISNQIEEVQESISDATNSVGEIKENVSNVTNAVGEISNRKEEIEKLSKLTPLSNDELKAWLPQEVNGMDRVGYSTGKYAMMKIASIEGTFANEDQEFKLVIIDGAGEMGATTTMGLRMALSQDFEEVNENRLRRTITRNGVKAIEEYEKKSNNSTIQLMQGDRFHLEVQGTNMDLEETWETIDELNLDDLV